MQYFSAFSSSLLLLSYCVWGLFFQGFKESLILSLKKVEFFLPFGFCPPKVGSVVFVSFILGWDLFWVFICLFVFPLMGKAEWGVNPVCWWLALYFCFVCCLDEESCTGCYWWLGDVGSCIQVVSFVWALTIWYSLGQPTPVRLPGKSHGQRGLVGCSPRGCEELDTTEWCHFHFSLSCIGGGNDNPLQCSCLENPRDGGAWWAAVYGAAQSQTRLKWLSSSSSSSRVSSLVV